MKTQLEWLRCQVLGQKCWQYPKDKGGAGGGKESAVRRTWPRSKRFKVKAKRAKASTQWLKITVGYLSTPSADEGAGGSGEGLAHTHTQLRSAVRVSI